MHCPGLINITMSGQTKPLYQMERQLQYRRHLQRLQSIGKQRSRRVLQRDPIKEMHRLRNHSSHFHTQQHVDHLNHQNEKIINKLMHIAKRRSSSFFKPEEPSMVYYDNPTRKRTKHEIQKSNIALAERILSKHSEFQSSNQRRMIDEYERTKKMLEHNKRASLPQLEEMGHSRSMEKMPRPKEVYSTLENKQQ